MTSPAPIPSPAAVVCYVHPAPPPPLDKATVALNALEHKRFAPGTPANNLYQVIFYPWKGLFLSIIVFPGEHVAELADLLQPHGLALTRGVPVVSTGEGTAALEVEDVVREHLRVSVGERRYCFCARGDGPAAREAPALSPPPGEK